MSIQETIRLNRLNDQIIDLLKEIEALHVSLAAAETLRDKFKSDRNILKNRLEIMENDATDNYKKLAAAEDRVKVLEEEIKINQEIKDCDRGMQKGRP